MRALEFLIEISLIGRAGMECFVFVHKKHMRPWVVQTFSLKRLEMENMGGTTSALKRTLNKTTCNEDDHSMSKIPRKDGPAKRGGESTRLTRNKRNLNETSTDVVMSESLDNVTKLNYDTRPRPQIDSIETSRPNSRKERYAN